MRTRYRLGAWSGRFGRSGSQKRLDGIRYHSGVCESDDETVFGSGISVLGLGDKSLSCVVVGFAFPTLQTQISQLFCGCVCLSPAMERQ